MPLLTSIFPDGIGSRHAYNVQTFAIYTDSRVFPLLDESASPLLKTLVLVEDAAICFMMPEIMI